MSCDLDAMYEMENRENATESIDDETLIMLVKSNRLLYDKSCKDFKNVSMKKDTWTAISLGCGASSGEAAEQRWNQLRNYLARVKRNMNKSLPSGSGGGKKTAVWPLMASMEFLFPFIENRKKRGSLDPVSSDCISETPYPGETFNIPSPLASPSEIDSPSSVWDSTSQILRNETEDEEMSSGRDTPSPALPKRKERSVLPPPDKFAVKKKKSMDGLELLMKQSADAMTSVAASLQDTAMPTDTNKTEPYLCAIKKAFEEVPPEKQLDCMLAVLHVIQDHKKQ